MNHCQQRCTSGKHFKQSWLLHRYNVKILLLFRMKKKDVEDRLFDRQLSYLPLWGQGYRHLKISRSRD